MRYSAAQKHLFDGEYGMTDAPKPTRLEQLRLANLGFVWKSNGIRGMEDAPYKSYRIVYGAEEYTLVKDEWGFHWEKLGTHELADEGYKKLD